MKRILVDFSKRDCRGGVELISVTTDKIKSDMSYPASGEIVILHDDINECRAVAYLNSVQNREQLGLPDRLFFGATLVDELRPIWNEGYRKSPDIRTQISCSH